MKLYPCVLLGDFGTAKLADTLTTEQRYRWSTTDDTNFNIDLTRAQALWDRKSLRIWTGAATAAGDEVYYGIKDTDLDDTDIMNAFGDSVDDLSWCTELGCWLYHTDDVYAGGDPDEFYMLVTEDRTGTDVTVNWTSKLDTADKWEWVHGTPASGSFSANANDVEQYGFAATAAFTASSYFYVNTFVAFRTTLSTASHDYNANNAIHLDSSSFIPTGQNSWRVTGNLVGPRDSAGEKRVMDLARQLHEMETLGLSELPIVRRPTPKYQAMKDCGNIKTYLMYVEETLGENGGSYVTCAVPVIITDVQTKWVAPSKNIISFSFNAHRFAGV